MVHRLLREAISVIGCPQGMQSRSDLVLIDMMLRPIFGRHAAETWLPKTSKSPQVSILIFRLPVSESNLEYRLAKNCLTRWRTLAVDCRS